MKYLLDTCTFIWLACLPEKIGAKAKESLDAGFHVRHVSVVSIWEIIIKHSIRKLELPEEPRVWIDHQLRIHDIEVLGLECVDIYRSSELPTIHKDPYDRMLVAQALEKSCVVLTPDKVYQEYGCKTIWD